MLSRSFILLILGICFCATAAPKAAFAHAALVESTPSDQAQLDSSPTELVLRFNEPVRAVMARLLNPRGQDLLDPNQVSTANETLRAVLPEALPQGVYLFSYRVISADSHPVRGSLVFSVGAPLTPGGEGSASLALDAPGWQGATTASRGLYLVSLALMLGAVLFFLLIGFEHGAAALRSRAIIYAAGALSALTLVLSIGLEGAGIADASIERLLEPKVWRLGLDTTRGTAAIVALLGLGLMAAFYPLSLRQRMAKLALWLGAALVLASLVLSGHAVTAAPGWLARPIWLVHVTVAMFWIGSLLPLLYVLRREGGGVRAIRRFSAVAVIAVPAMLAAGMAMAALQMEAWSPLLETHYGRWLMAKLVLVSVLLALAAYNRARLAPRLSADASARKRFSLTVRVELLVGLAVLCIAAGLSHQIPPRALMIQSDVTRQERTLVVSGGWTAEITVAPAKAGRNDISVRFLDRKRQSVEPIEVNVELSNPAMGVEPFSRPLQQLAPGVYHVAASDILFPGRWEIRVDALISDFDKLSFSTEVVVR